MANIAGVININTRLTSVLSLNTITVASSSAFSVGDTILIIQMNGATIDATNTITSGTVLDYAGAGNYDIDEIVGI